MTSEPPRISVIVPTHNPGPILERCLRSVAAQDYPDRELLVVDGASTDTTSDLLDRFADHIDVLIVEPDDGVYQARNKAIRQATGDWICFLGADDYLWSTDVLTKLAPHLVNAEKEGVRVVYSHVVLVDAAGDEIETLGRPWEERRDRFRQEMSIPHPGLMHHRSLFEERGLFDESFSVAGDYELLLRELKEREARFVPIRTVGMGYGGKSTQPLEGPMVLRESLRALRKNDLPTLRPRIVAAFAWHLALAFLHRALGNRAGQWITDNLRVAAGKSRVRPVRDEKQPGSPRLN